MKDYAYGKINLSLDVFNVREDGYHDIHSIMLPIDFYDELEIEIAQKDSFSCNRRFLRYDERNSIHQMISLLKSRYGIDDHHKIVLNKVIPTRAGLGGGTADAAGTLRIFEKLYDLKLSKEEKIDLCVHVGADVPFNYFNIPAIVEGIGEKITPIELKKTYYILLVKPDSGVSTKEAYETLNMDLCDHPDIEALKNVLEEGGSLKGLLGNSLQESAFRLNPGIKEIRDLLLSYQAGEVLMSGSGSTLFCISEEEQTIAALYQELKGKNLYLRFTKTLNRK